MLYGLIIMRAMISVSLAVLARRPQNNLKLKRKEIVSEPKEDAISNNRETVRKAVKSCIKRKSSVPACENTDAVGGASLYRISKLALDIEIFKFVVSVNVDF